VWLFKYIFCVWIIKIENQSYFSNANPKNFCIDVTALCQNLPSHSGFIWKFYEMKSICGYFDPKWMNHNICCNCLLLSYLYFILIIWICSFVFGGGTIRFPPPTEMSLHCIQKGSLAHQTSYSVGNRMKWLGREAPDFHVVPTLTVLGAIRIPVLTVYIHILVPKWA
jgi:hypothetical protein